MLELVRRCLPEAAAVEPRHGQGRVRRLAVTLNDGTRRECVLRRAPIHELDLYRTRLEPAATGAPAILGWAPAPEPGEAWLLLEALPEHFPDYTSAADVAQVYTHLAALHHRFRAGHRTLIHGDYHRWNLLLVDGRVRVLDWEHSILARPVWDLVLLAPEEPGWDGVPRGPLAELALRTYHQAGPLAHLPWPLFLRLQVRARLVVASRWARVHGLKAAGMPQGGAREQVQAYADMERQRAKRLATLLRTT